MNAHYYCPNNIVIKNGIPNQYDKDRYMVFDYFVLDKSKKEIIYLHDIPDGFIDLMNNIDKIEVRIKPDNKEQEIKLVDKDGNPQIITLDKKNRITGYINNNVKALGEGFLSKNRVLSYLELQNVEKIGNNSFYENIGLTSVDFPKVKYLGKGVLYRNESISEIYSPALEYLGEQALMSNEQLTAIDFPMCRHIGNMALRFNTEACEVYFPLVEYIGDGVLWQNKKLEKIELPSVKHIGDGFLLYNDLISEIILPEVEEIVTNVEDIRYIDEGSKSNEYFLTSAKLKKIIMPKLSKLIGKINIDWNVIEELDLSSLPLIQKLRYYPQAFIKGVEL